MVSTLAVGVGLLAASGSPPTSLEGLVGLLDGEKLPVREVLEFLSEVGDLVRVIAGHRPLVRGLDLLWGGPG